MKKKFYLVHFIMFLLGIHGTVSCAQSGPAGRMSVPEEIRFEATLGNNHPVGRPLPLASHWNSGQLANGFSPAYQMQMIENGHHLLPWFSLDWVQQTEDAYYHVPLQKAFELKLPISFVSTQWEHVLTDDPLYFNLPPDQNPNVVDVTGQILKMVSPFGPLDPWREVGKNWTSSTLLKKLQKWYPDPPLVLFVSNNEHAKLQWIDAEDSSQYLTLYGNGQTDEFKRSVVAEGWITHYRALQEGMRDGLDATAWKNKAKFVGYDAFGPVHYGRWGGWREYSLMETGRIDPNPSIWDGGSPSFYTHDWNQSTDFRVFSPQIEFMNLVFQQKEAYKLNPNFWLEFSTWDGDDDKRKYYAQLGQTFNPDRYGGMVQFGMWLLTPRVVREFRGWTDTLSNAEPYFLAIVNAVDRVYANATLKKFWRRGQLVANLGHQHPYQSEVPSEYKMADRWFLLDTNLDPPRPWNLNTELPVFSLARVLGKAPQREWIVYAYSPLKERKNVQISLPGYGPIQIDAQPAGKFYHVIERTKKVLLIPK